MNLPGKILAAALALAVLSACGGSNDEAPENSEPAPSQGSQSTQQGDSAMENPQLAKADGPTAVIKTSLGDITVQLYPKEAPKAVENFITHAKDGYYDGIVFHRVISNFMIQGGDPTATGRGGESIWGHSFEDEFSPDLHNFRGALSMANSGTDTNGSQFFIVQCAEPITDDTATPYMFQWTLNRYQRQLDLAPESEAQELMDQLNGKLSDYQQNGLPQELLDEYQPAVDVYREVGGTPHLDYKHTVFGQVIAGMEVVDNIAAVATDDSDKPVTDVTILSIQVNE